MDQEDPIAQFFPGQDDVDLYAVLSLDSSTTADAVRKAYRRLALIYHPDKHSNSSEETRGAASIKFQQVGFAYSVLSDEKRRARYDKTGRTDEGFDLQPGEDGWDAYFSELFDTVTKGKLDELKKEYQGSAEEIEDIKRAYLKPDHTIEEIMNHIPHSTVDDEARFIVLVSQLIKDGELPTFKAWEKSVKDEKSKLVRQKQSEKEAAEAEELAKELGVWDEFYGSGKPGSRKRKGKAKNTEANATDEEDTSVLQALILKKKKNMGGFFDNLAAKYAEPEAKARGKKGKKREGDEDDQPTGKKSKAAPSEIDDEEFEKLQQKLFGHRQNDSTSDQGANGKGQKVAGKGGKGRKSK